MVKTIDIESLPGQFAEAVALASSGAEIILTQDSVPQAKLVPFVAAARVPGLHQGAMAISQDFDAALS